MGGSPHLRAEKKTTKDREGCRLGCMFIYVELARTIYIQYIYGIFGRKTTEYTVIYGVYIRFWPTLYICVKW
jgi:hypothetical protein